MKTDNNDITRRPFIKHRWVFNLLWWIGMTIVWSAIFYTPVFDIIGDAESSLFGTHWQVWFFGIVVPFLFLQTVFHWYAQNYVYPERRESNIVWVILMPIFLFIGNIVILSLLFAYSVHGGARPFD